MKNFTQETKLTIQILLSIVLVIAGIVLLFLGFYFPPQGEIHDSVLIAYGEVSTFAGSILGVDYSYRYKAYMLDKQTKDKKNEE